MALEWKESPLQGDVWEAHIAGVVSLWLGKGCPDGSRFVCLAGLELEYVSIGETHASELPAAQAEAEGLLREHTAGILAALGEPRWLVSTQPCYHCGFFTCYEVDGESVEDPGEGKAE